VRDLEVQLVADQDTEKALLERARASHSLSTSESLKIRLVEEDLANIRAMKGKVVERLEGLRYSQKAESRVAPISSAVGGQRTLSPGARWALLAFTPLVVFFFLCVVSLLREVISGRSRTLASQST
jgi:hypothetical protein